MGCLSNIPNIQKQEYHTSMEQPGWRAAGGRSTENVINPAKTQQRLFVNWKVQTVGVLDIFRNLYFKVFQKRFLLRAPSKKLVRFVRL